MQALLTCSSAEGLTSARKPRTAVYSLNWAAIVVSRALQSYPRAWEIIMDVTALEMRQLVILLASNDPSWPALRSMVHTLDRWLKRQELAGPADLKKLPITTQMLSTLVRVGGKNAPESLLHYLTTRISQLTIEEQVKRAEGAASSAPDILSGPPAESTACGVQYVFDFR